MDETGKPGPKDAEEFIAEETGGELSSSDNIDSRKSEEPSEQSSEESSDQSVEFQLTPEIEAKLSDLKYMIDHWHDPLDIVNPISKFSKGGASGRNVKKFFDIEYVLDRPVYFQETRILGNIKSVVEEGVKYGSIGIMPFYYANYGFYPEFTDRAEAPHPEDYDVTIAGLNNIKEESDGWSIPICYIFAGETAKSLNRIAMEHKDRADRMGLESRSDYLQNFGELSGLGSDPKVGEELNELSPHPTGIILGVIPTESHFDDLLIKRQSKIESLEIKKQETTESKQIDLIDKEILSLKSEIEYLRIDAVDGRKNRLFVAKTMGEISGMSVFDLEGNLLWPRQMSYEEVKQFVAERDAKKAQSISEEPKSELSSEPPIQPEELDETS